jgi:hypothetical protein
LIDVCCVIAVLAFAMAALVFTIPVFRPCLRDWAEARWRGNGRAYFWAWLLDHFLVPIGIQLLALVLLWAFAIPWLRQKAEERQKRPESRLVHPSNQPVRTSPRSFACQ